MKNKQLLCTVLFYLIICSVNAQQLWNTLDKSEHLYQKKELYEKKNFPAQYKLMSLELNSFKDKLHRKTSADIIIELPNQYGNLSKFLLKETSNFEAGLQAKFPEIKSYTAKGIDDPTAIAKISIGIDGFHGVIFSGNTSTIYIDPYSKDKKDYILYNKKSLNPVNHDFECMVKDEMSKMEFSSSKSLKNADDGKLRTFRLAIVCSGGYSQFHLSRQNIASTASDSEKKAAVLSAMNTSMTRINGIFEKDLAVKMVIVENNDEVIFLDADTDNITDGNAETMIDEVQTIADTRIGATNYDIGHIFSIGGSGLAGLGVVCINGQKARGVTGISSPVNDPYDIDFVAHELGHQFGATHTQNNSCNRTNSTAVEPGSGSTIMGYAGICAPNVIGTTSTTGGNSDDHFHAVSIAQMWATIESSANCANLTDTNNSAPTADAGEDFSIPKSTPFKLTGVATDDDGMGSLTYNWEQLDNEVGTMPPLSTNSVGPMFLSLPSKLEPVRYMPSLETVLAGNTSSTWEVLPSVAREMNFSFLVRDNHAGGGSTARDDMKVTITDDEAFTVSAPSTSVVWDVGSTQTISWNKGTTDVAPINCTLVNIKLSTDGGVTFPITLKSNTANDGSESIIIPDNATTRARIMVEASDNIFYNVNNSNFTINSTTPTFILNNVSGSQTICNNDTTPVEYTLNFDFVNGFSESVTLSTTGEPAGSNVSFNPSTISSDGNVKMTVSDLNGKPAQEYQINVTGTSTSVNQNINVVLKLNSSNFGALTLTSPSNNAIGVNISAELIWDEDTNATSYDVEVASDNGFSNIVSSGNVTTNNYISTNLSSLSQYYWRVKSKNDCGEGSFSEAFSFTTLEGSYCSSTFTDEIGGTEHIQNVTFGGINNDSGNDTTDGYQDFTSIGTNLLRGQERQISVTYDTGGFQDHCFVFIDWNQNFVFDNDTERYDLGSRTEDVATSTFTIRVPDEANYGTTRMRIVLEYDDPDDGYGEGACDDDHLTEWGETEDYSVTVVQPTLNANNYTFTKTDESIFNGADGSINLAIAQSEFTYGVVIAGPSTNIDETISTTNYTLSNLQPGSYNFCITAIEVNDEQCFDIEIEAVEPTVNPDNYLINTFSETCSNENDGAIDITINQQEYTYSLTITGSSTNVSQSLSGLTYNLSNLAPGDYEICITAIEANATNCYQVTIEEAQQIALKVAAKSANSFSFKVSEGTSPYEVFLDDELIGVSSSSDFDLEINEKGILKVKTALACEGVYEKSINDILSIDDITRSVTILKNPVTDFIELQLSPSTENERIKTSIFDVTGKLIYQENINVLSEKIKIPAANFAKGVYILKLSIKNGKPLKILKQ